MRHNLNGLVDDAEHEENELLLMVVNNAQKTQASLAVYVVEIDFCGFVFVGFHLGWCFRFYRQCFECTLAQGPPAPTGGIWL